MLKIGGSGCYRRSVNTTASVSHFSESWIAMTISRRQRRQCRQRAPPAAQTMRSYKPPTTTRGGDVSHRERSMLPCLTSSDKGGGPPGEGSIAWPHSFSSGRCRALHRFSDRASQRALILLAVRGPARTILVGFDANTGRGENVGYLGDAPRLDTPLIDRVPSNDCSGVDTRLPAAVRGAFSRWQIRFAASVWTSENLQWTLGTRPHRTKMIHIDRTHVEVQ